MPGLKRHYEIWVGEQLSGKTHQLRRRVRVLASKPRITAIFICDRLNEHGDMGIVVHGYTDYIEACEDDKIPRVVVCQCGPDADAYEIFFRECLELGGCVLVLDEAYEFAPVGHVWRSNQLKMIVLSGRHLPNAAGKECVTHLLVATQYPRSVHHQLWGQARTVMCGVIAGENAREWVRGNFGAPALEKVDALIQWEWVRLRGPAPELGPNLW